MTKAVRISTDGQTERIEVGPYPAISHAVGGYIEAVVFPLLGSELTGYVDEEGKLKGLEVNLRATELSGLYPHDVICGPMVVLGPVDDEGNELDIPQECADLLLGGWERKLGR